MDATENPATTALAVLDTEECLRLLAHHHFGRLGVVVDGQPLVFPVNYALDGRDIVFRTNAGTKLFGATGHRVAFEIDDSDTMYHSGWSVLVVGVAEEEHDPLDIIDLTRLPLSPWCPGERHHWMRIRSNAITGRRLAR